MIAGGFAIFRLIQWIRQNPGRPDPWGKEIEDALHRDDAVALCHHCLAEQPEGVHFCPECETATGACTNLLPFDYLFTLGETLRIGSCGRFRVTPITVTGFFIISLVQYAIFAPVYWYFLLRNLSQMENPTVAPPADPTPLPAE